VMVALEVWIDPFRVLKLLGINVSGPNRKS